MKKPVRPKIRTVTEAGNSRYLDVSDEDINRTLKVRRTIMDGKVIQGEPFPTDLAINYCCEDLEQQLNNNCEQHGVQCPDNIVQKRKDYEKNDIIVIPHPDGQSYFEINYCPWCGTKFK